MIDWYILDDNNNVVKAATYLEGAEWLERNRDRKRVAQDDVVIDGQTYWVSTVFLGIDHGYDNNSVPVVFETMVFAKDSGGNINYSELYMNRYSYYDDALAGHEYVVSNLESLI